MMEANAVKQLLVKELAPNDNSKNQPYIARGDLQAINILPTGEFRAEFTKKNRETLKAPLDFYWLQPDGSRVHAPDTQVILYPQYPEIRLSGFLNRARSAPNSLMNSRSLGRLLFLGVTNDRKIMAWATDAGSQISEAYRALEKLEQIGVFKVVPVRASDIGTSSRNTVLNELRRIHNLNWIDSKALSADGSLLPCNSAHCVGYTLEAEFGVARNGISEPDFQGWELTATTVKNLKGLPSSKAVTLMTPEPTSGFYKSEGLEAFVRKFGYPDKRGRPDRLNFGGNFYLGTRHTGTALTLRFDGYDVADEQHFRPSGSLALVTDNDVIAAEWSFCFTDVALESQTFTSRLYSSRGEESAPTTIQIWRVRSIW